MSVNELGRRYHLTPFSLHRNSAKKSIIVAALHRNVTIKSSMMPLSHTLQFV